jgi:hypothetical protein
MQLKHRLGAALAAASFIVAATAAAEPIKVARSVPYKDISVGTADVRQECDWNTQMIDYLVQYSRGTVVATDENLDTAPGMALKLVVVGIHTAGGGAFSGPKWVKIRGELLLNGKVINNFQKTSHSMDLFRGSCSVANKMGKQLSGWLAKWLRKPANLVDDEGIADDKGDTAADKPDAAKQ